MITDKTLGKPHCEILVVDDDKIIQFLHKAVVKLCRPDSAVSLHDNEKMALEFIEGTDEPSPYFLVLLDINMPVIDVFEFQKECRNGNFQNIFVVMVSSTNKEDKLQWSEFKEVGAYCEKPLYKEKMQEILGLEKLMDCWGPQARS